MLLCTMLNSIPHENPNSPTEEEIAGLHAKRALKLAADKARRYLREIRSAIASVKGGAV